MDKSMLHTHCTQFLNKSDSCKEYFGENDYMHMER